MGDLSRTAADSYFKMNVATWLLSILGVITLATPALSSEPRVVCYYTNWSVYRPGTARFNPQNINPYLCTHLIYAFGGFTKDNTLKPFDKYQDIEKGGYAKFTGLKTYNKNLKTMLAIGGWNEGSSKFSPMVASRERRKEFVRNAIKFLRQNRFDGLDLDWEYPAFRDGGKPKDRENYARLVKELRDEFEREAEKTNKPRLLLTMAVPAGIEYIQKGFDVKTLNQYLDWMNLLTYDYHSAFEPAVNHHAPLYPLEEPNEYSVDTELNIDYTIKFYLENGADADKLVLGIPTYGRSYTLFNADAVEIGSPADGPGEQGDATREKGYLAYYEICEALKPKSKKRSISSDEDSEEYDEEEEEEEEWTIMHPNPSAMGPVAYRGNQWVGYDDVDIVRKKAEYVAENGLGGIMFWSIDNDDFRGTCHSKPYPLIEAAKEAYIAKIGTGTVLRVTEKAKTGGRVGNRRRNKLKTSTTTEKPSAASKSNKRKSSVSSTTPSWNVTPEPPTTPDPGSDFKCTDEGFFQHPRDCKKYFWCLDSGPSNLGIVAHQFTCPSGLFFNKAADSCDFARNVLCKLPEATTKPPATKPPATKPTKAITITTTPATTTRKPIRLSTKSSALFRTTTTTTAAPQAESEEEYEDVQDDTFDEDSEDPRVIKELIDLIKKVGGVEQLEKQLHLAESQSASTDGGSVTTPSPLNKKLYQKVLDRARGKNKFTGNSLSGSFAQNSRRGPQSLQVETPEKEKPSSNDRSLNKDRPQYTSINRQRASTSTTEEPLTSDEEQRDSPPQFPSRARAVDTDTFGTTAKSLQYVNIRRARPTTSSDTADDTASRNALFERSETSVSVSEPNSLNIASARRENTPEYVTIRRQRPTTEEATTIQYEVADSEVDLQETALEREISSQPQYTSIVRARSTTLSTPEEPPTTEPTFAPKSSPTTPTPEESSPEPTTVLAVQISSLLNSPSEDEEAAPETPVAKTEAEPTTTSTTAAPSSVTPRRTLLRRRGSTTTTTPALSSSTTQAARRPFPRRTKATSAPETTEESTTEFETTPAPGPSKFKLRKAAEAARKEAAAFSIENQASLKEAEASQKEKEASRIEDDAFRKEAARNNTGRGSKRPSQIASAYRKEAQESRKQAEAFRKEAAAYRKGAEESRRAVERNETRIADRGPVRASQTAATRRNERPATRNFVRRRLGGGDGSPSTTVAPPSSSVTRRSFRIASRRRPATSSTTTSSTTTQPTTTQPTTLMVESEELLQDIGDTDAIEDPTLEPRAAKKDSKIQRRPLVNLRDDQNPSATNEDERTRQSKKYSSTFKQNQLDTLLKGKSGEVTTEADTTVDENAETALAIATHQLITAPLPSTDFEGTSRYNTEYTSSDTEYTKTPTYEEHTTAFRTVPTQDFVQTTLEEAYSVYDTPRVTTDDFRTTAGLTTTKSRRPFSTTNYEEKTTYELPKTTTRQETDTTDIDPGKFTLETFPSTIPREGFTNFPTDFVGITQTTFEAPKLSTLSRYPTTPAYQTVTNQYVPSTRGYTENVTNEYVSTTRDYTETTDPTSYSSPRFYTETADPTSYSSPRFNQAKAVRGFSSPNVITPGYTSVQRGGVKYETDKYGTIPENTDATVRTRYSTIPAEDTRSTRVKYTTVAEDVGSSVGYTSSSREPTGFFSREYLLQLPVTKSYDEQYQYLSPTTPQTTTRKVFRKKIQRRISTTIRPTTSTVRFTTPTYVPEVTTPRPTLRPRQPSKKPFEKIAKDVPNRTFRPVVNYDYYDDSAERVALKYAEGTKVILHGKGSIECLDVGNFPHPSSCKKFISCARMEFGSLLGWEYVCPQGLSFDPVGGICNWSAGLGCEEKDP